MTYLSSAAMVSARGSQRILAAAVAIILAFGLAVMVAPQARAANRDWLRPDSTGACEWDGVGYWVQRCDVWSPSMGRNIQVQIQPAQRGGNAGLYLLDGLRATRETNAWVKDVNAAQVYADHNITLVMPVGGTASFYMDWEGPATYDYRQPVKYQWETFLTKELPPYLEQHFGVARNNNSIIGLSMGGSAAITLAGKHPDQFRQAMSYSGYLNYTFPGAHSLMRFALWDAGGFNVNAMYGSLFSPRRFESDPMYQIPGLRNTDVYISAASGIPGPADRNIALEHHAAGIPLEIFSLLTTKAWEVKARAMGIRVTSDYPPTGEHNWATFGHQLVRTKKQVLDVMNAW
ncbi:esterase [Corynebacterium phocae]|uniref:Esterase n=1 Tax=Corynebacterium phocae TaxID=161895 RepID=A0A1L7D5T2_9CORY|nr:alpha/beta hydrolase family protein [Corynebacterium phocae]APT93401.1 esterase [Corynebacterium phocae]KAA8721096.1 esterase family protein [Corynebacterium phocae]